jgi:hypothetical protein
VALTASILDVTALVVQSLTAIAAVVLAYIGLRLTAKPGIRVHVGRDGHPERVRRRHRPPVVFAPREEAVLSISVELRGFFYGKPTATDMTITVNVDQAWSLKQLSWSAPGQSERHEEEVAPGKGLKSGPWWAIWRSVPSTGPSKFLVADRLWLTRDEQAETLGAVLVAPDTPGTHVGWIHARAREGDCGVHVFRLECRQDSVGFSRTSA